MIVICLRQWELESTPVLYQNLYTAVLAMGKGTGTHLLLLLHFDYRVQSCILLSTYISATYFMEDIKSIIQNNQHTC